MHLPCWVQRGWRKFEFRKFLENKKVVKHGPVVCALHPGYTVMERVVHQSIIEMYHVIGLDGVQKWIKISFFESRESILKMSTNSWGKFHRVGEMIFLSSSCLVFIMFILLVHYCFASDSIENWYSGVDIFFLTQKLRLRNKDKFWKWNCFLPELVGLLHMAK